MADTNIEWTQRPGTIGAVWNPTTGCDKISDGCTNCYALTMAKRLKAMGQAKYQNDGHPVTSGPGFGLTVHPDELHTPLRWRKPRTVFVNSMSDLFHARVPRDFLARVFAVMATTPQHTYQILTKRPERMARLLSQRDFRDAALFASPLDQPTEVRAVPGWPGYAVSSSGVVLSDIRGDRRTLSPDVGEQGHQRVTLYDGHGGSSRMLVHRLVLDVFDRPGKPDEQARHRNGDTSDNRLANLVWGSQADNWADRLFHGHGRSWSKLSGDDVRTIRSRAAAGEPAYAIAKDFPVSDTQIRNVVDGRQWTDQTMSPGPVWPLTNCWLGTSIESDKHVGRADALRATPSAVRFISAEPLLGPLPSLDLTGIDWLIIGGESGPGARPMDLQWVEELIGRARDAGTAVFVKQLGKVWAGSGKGGDWLAWPEHLRIREYPDERVAVTA